ncbi:putative transcriptional regulator [Actinoalloteichus hoggarensis]|uniref:CBS domain protein n=1 Tax=Actinoalloteichus hoggarensis TaxID=1470176 RepID=A0A221W460_9PSEU|nr:CBS domain-containing protein [Actinoalloteichus hoggarensis]ASO20608.1 CBS domain protein [Actinoalloteichus hoggarensis]MBB5923649.1 putative transcriptional regulator [Actinoalloteichus hoggarensis]
MAAESGTRGEDTPRTQYLIDGRRVTVSDLLQAGLIQAGTRLRFTRTRIGAVYDAIITDTGRIRLESDGEEFRSPSRAAMVAAGMRAVDGWRAWTVVGQDRLLDAVRQELLDQAADGSRRQPSQDSARQSVHDRLRQARERAEKDDPERVSVRELLTFWGAADRGDQVSQIEADLANHGLVTSPSFRAVTLDTMVLLTTPPVDEEDRTAGDVGLVAEHVADDEGEDDLNVRLTVGNLSPLSGVVSVSPDSRLTEAITKMLVDDYSQLAVLSGARNLRGAVTWRSVALALQQEPDAIVADALEPDVEAVPYDRDLFEILPRLQQRYFVFVLDETKAVKGIVTTADVAHRYGEMATPFFHLGELDQTLRWVLSRVFDIEEVGSVCGRQLTGFDRLTIGDYQRILENREMWQRLGWPLDRSAFIARLDEIRVLRNKIMHFHSDPVPEDAVAKLQKFNLLLRNYRDRA